MDPDRFRAVYERLQALDESSTFKVRPKVTLQRPTVEELDVRYTLELIDRLRPYGFFLLYALLLLGVLDLFVWPIQRFLGTWLL